MNETCNKECRPEFDEHSEICIKRYLRIMQCRYCSSGDDCMICGRSEGQARRNRLQAAIDRRQREDAFYTGGY